METKQAEYKTDIALLDKGNADRHVQLIIVILIGMGLMTAILGMLIRLP